jgi:peroxiredoxin
MLRSRYVPWLILGGVGVLASVLQVAEKVVTGAAPSAQQQGEVQLSAVVDRPREKHPVTPRQLADSNAMLSRAVADMAATAHDGRRRAWAELSGGQPVVVVFIKDGCPCSSEFEPFFQRVATLYAGHVRFVGVIDAPVEVARRYAAEQHVAHLILADSQQRIIRRLNARHGGYVALLRPDGVIDGFWPGCTATTMQELGRRIARLAGVAQRPLDVTGMPAALITGCPFDL